MKRKCDCREWEVSAAILDSLVTIATIHGVTYDGGMPFVYCPWCGKKLAEPSPERSEGHHPNPIARRESGCGPHGGAVGTGLIRGQER